MPYMHKLSELNVRLEDRASLAKKSAQRLSQRIPSAAAFDILSGCIVYKMACLRCNCSFKADLNHAGITYNNSVCCPYCGREDQLRIQKGRLL